MSIGKWPFSIPEEMPLALGIRGVERPGQVTWEDWQEDMLRKYPVRFRLGYRWSRDIRSAFFRRFWNYVSEGYYWFRTHFVPGHRYHMLDLRNKANGYAWGWRDFDVVVLFSVMAALVDFVEAEKGFESHVSWENEPDQVPDQTPDLNDPKVKSYIFHHRPGLKDVKDDCLRIYKWWTVERPAKLIEIDGLLEEAFGRTQRAVVATPESVASRNEKAELVNRTQEALKAEEQANLIRLIELRAYLWT
jgi:hypothetical protein